MQNEKNRLQEYADKRHLPHASYDPKRVGGQDHSPVWQSTVTLWNGTTYTGKCAGDRVTSERSAAQVALVDLTEVAEENMPPIMVEYETALLVDLENKPKLLEQLSQEQLTRMRVYAFVGKHHDLVNMVLPRGVTRVVSPSTRRDGTDCCMQVYTGSLLTMRVYKEYLIATSDHFGPVLVEMIQSENILWPTANARLVTMANQV